MVLAVNTPPKFINLTHPQHHTPYFRFKTQRGGAKAKICAFEELRRITTPQELGTAGVEGHFRQ